MNSRFVASLALTASLLMGCAGKEYIAPGVEQYQTIVGEGIGITFTTSKVRQGNYLVENGGIGLTVGFWVPFSHETVISPLMPY